MLAQGCPPDAGLIHTELSKMLLLADSNGRLPPGTVERMGQTQDLGLFELMRLVQQNGNRPAVWRRILDDTLAGDTMVFAFIAVLRREARLLWQICAGDRPTAPAAALAGKETIAQSLGFAGIAKIWDLALKADKGIKTGERTPEQAFEMLASELFILFQG
jgi:DNA polymerase-3 subunit delta